MSDLLTDFQSDVVGRLMSCTDLKHVAVIAQRGTSDAKMKGLRDQINEHLAGLKKTQGRSGLAVLVLMPEVHIEKGTMDVPGPQIKLVAAIQVIENEEVNRRDKGTGIPAGELALTILGLMHLFSFGDVLTLAEEKGITALALDEEMSGDTALQVNVTAPLATTPLTKMVAPTLAKSGSNFTLSGAVGGAHWYTLDGSYPLPDTQGSHLYSAAVAVSAGTVVRAASYAEGFTGSDITKLIIT